MLKFLGKHWRVIGLSIVCVFVVGYVATSLTIGRQVERVVSLAQSQFEGEPTDALMSLALSEAAPFAERNRAIWALGQLGAKEALPALESLIASLDCDHPSSICQYELGKAIELCSGSFNVGAVVWRHGELAAR